MQAASKVLAVTAIALATSQVHASQLQYWSQNGFTQMAYMPGVVQEAHLDTKLSDTQPERFKAQGLYYKRENNILTIGLQTGFNLKTGIEKDLRGKSIYAGDIALSFGDKGVPAQQKPLSQKDYNYGVNFGLTQQNYFRSRNGSPTLTQNSKKYFTKDEGLYSVNQWNTETYYRTVAYATESNLNDLAPGNKKVGGGLLSNESHDEGSTFARIVAIDLNKVKDADGKTIGNSELRLHAYWTMSCGNDNIWGDAHIPAAVPVPAAAWLLGSGLLGLVGLKRKKKAEA